MHAAILRLPRSKSPVLRWQLDPEALAERGEVAIVVFVSFVAGVKSNQPCWSDALQFVASDHPVPLRDSAGMGDLRFGRWPMVTGHFGRISSTFSGGRPMAARLPATTIGRSKRIGSFAIALATAARELFALSSSRL